MMELPDNVTGKMMSPEASRNMYEVFIADTRSIESIKTDCSGENWAWEYFDLGNKRPTISTFISAFSPTLHHAIDLTHEDFQDPPCNSVKPNDEAALLGVRVVIQGLTGRADLNGAIARCGVWIEKRERYQVFLPTYDRGPLSFAAKPSNLLIAEKIAVHDSSGISKLLSADKRNTVHRFPSVILSFFTSRSKRKVSLLDYLFDLDSGSVTDYCVITDQYNGPVCRAAQVILRAIDLQPKAHDMISCIIKPPGMEGKDNAEGYSLLRNYYKTRKDRDSRRVREFEREISETGKVSSTVWLRLVVKLDGISPTVEREIIVSPKISMQQLHNQVLAPSIGWHSNFHMYAFLRISKASTKYATLEEEDVNEAILMSNRECWIGPVSSTANDAVHQIWYIGGALANDKNIKLGSLYGPDSDGPMYLRYVYDFGDWWVSRCDYAIFSVFTVSVFLYLTLTFENLTESHDRSFQIQRPCARRSIGGISFVWFRLLPSTGLGRDRRIRGIDAQTLRQVPRSRRYSSK